MASNENKEQKTRGKTVRQSNITAARTFATVLIYTSTLTHV